VLPVNEVLLDLQGFLGGKEILDGMGHRAILVIVIQILAMKLPFTSLKVHL
jgi:hypothetical protein